MSDERRVQRMREYRGRLDAGIGALQAFEAVRIAEAALAEVAFGAGGDPRRIAANALKAMKAALGADGRERVVAKLVGEPVGGSMSDEGRVRFPKSKWMCRDWWGYLLSSPDRTSAGIPRLTVIACRVRGHDGEVFYNAGGLEPDHRCRRCLERIG